MPHDYLESLIKYISFLFSEILTWSGVGSGAFAFLFAFMVDLCNSEADNQPCMVFVDHLQLILDLLN